MAIFVGTSNNFERASFQMSLLQAISNMRKKEVISFCEVECRSQARGTRADKGWAVKRELRSSFNV